MEAIFHPPIWQLQDHKGVPPMQDILLYPFCPLLVRMLLTVPHIHFYDVAKEHLGTHTSLVGLPKGQPREAVSRNYLWHGVRCGERGRLPCRVEGIPPQLNCVSPDGKEAEEQGVGSPASCSCLSLFISEKPISNLPRVLKEINLILSTLLRVDTRPPLEHLLLVDPG